MQKISLAFKAFRELGPRKIWLYLRYQLYLRTGYLRWTTRSASENSQLNPNYFTFQPLLELPEREQLISILGVVGQEKLIREADEIVDGKVRLFGADPTPLNLNPPGRLQYWTVNKDSHTNERVSSSNTEPDIQILRSKDIKFIWEPCRFGWAFTLGRAYYISGNENYAAAFWKYTEFFLDSNPPYMGPNWSSGQEVALRLIAFSFSLQIFHNSRHSTPERIKRLTISIADHAARIPPTLIYARAQNNNHLLSEAAGLYTAGLTLPNHPQAMKWRRLGWKWFNQGIQTQITKEGIYIQHSSNYHRLMLQLALWMDRISRLHGEKLPDNSLTHLTEATRWILVLLDPVSGQVPNLGPNDGAYILPFTNCPFEDYRPVIQTAATTFLGISPILPGLWDEMENWIGLSGNTSKSRDFMQSEGFSVPIAGHTPATIRAPDTHSWAYLRAARFRDRPGHADQLHLDLWWRGINIAQDAGTFLYNAPQPWNNALAHTDVHNTLLIEHSNQMTQAGRFLFLDWAQAKIISEHINQNGMRDSLTAQHDGYRHLGVIHQREVTVTPKSSWLIKDQVISSSLNSANSKIFFATLHWLLPDWPWVVTAPNNHLQESSFMLNLESPQGNITLKISSPQGDQHEPQEHLYQLARAGKLIYGQGSVSPTWGWSSPTYGVRIPALSVRVSVRTNLPILLLSEWSFASRTE